MLSLKGERALRASTEAAPRKLSLTAQSAIHIQAFRLWSDFEQSRDKGPSSSLFYDADVDHALDDGTSSARPRDNLVQGWHPMTCGQGLDSLDSSDSGQQADSIEKLLNVDLLGIASPESPLGFWGGDWGSGAGHAKTGDASEVQTTATSTQDLWGPSENCNAERKEEKEAQPHTVFFMGHHLPRHCLLVVLRDSVRAKQTSQVVQIMQALGQMTPDEYSTCCDLINSMEPVVANNVAQQHGAPVSQVLISSSSTARVTPRPKGADDVGSFRRSITKSGMRTSVLTEEQAIDIFKRCPALRSKRAALCAELAQLYGVTSTSIRHIWDRKTWVWTTLPYLSKVELAACLAEGTCDRCRHLKVNKIENTCEHCPINRKRGRPRGSRDKLSRKR